MSSQQEIIVRPPVVGDSTDLGVVHCLAWQHGYREVLPGPFLDSLDPVQRGQRWAGELGRERTDQMAMVVADVAGQVVGFTVYGPYRPAAGSSDGLCELWALNVHPDFWGTGVAQALMAAALDGLRRDRPEPRAVLWVLEGNGRGRRFYEKIGWSADGTSKVEQIGGVPATELRYAIDL
jgi:GNAT superfamily N-acetyltransferase